MFRPHPGGCWSEALLLPDRQRDGAGLWLWVGCGCEVPYCYPGSRGGGWLLPGRGKGVGRAGCGQPAEAAVPTELPWAQALEPAVIASWCPGDVAVELCCHQSRIDPRKPADGSTVLPEL